MRIAIPTNNPGGMQARRSEHFGHCDVFTVVELDDDKNIKTVEMIATPEHGAGGCMVPVNTLNTANVNIIVVGGMGANPLRALIKWVLKSTGLTKTVSLMRRQLLNILWRVNCQ